MQNDLRNKDEGATEKGSKTCIANAWPSAIFLFIYLLYSKCGIIEYINIPYSILEKENICPHNSY